MFGFFANAGSQQDDRYLQMCRAWGKRLLALGFVLLGLAVLVLVHPLIAGVVAACVFGCGAVVCFRFGWTALRAGRARDRRNVRVCVRDVDADE